MIYIPPGRFLYGSTDDEATRAILNSEPAHDVEIGGFLIARTEVTNGDYIAFLRALPEPERRARLPGGLVLSSGGSLAWKVRDRVLLPGEPYCSGVQPCVDWSVLPVDGASRDDGEAYAAWLSRSHRLPHARLCRDREWERAGRGADDRRYPSGNADPGPTDACFLLTYGGDTLRAAPCAVGTHPATRSPFGVDDMVGSQWEWIAGPYDVAAPDQGHERSGGWASQGQYLLLTLRVEQEDPKGRSVSDGLRICADATDP
jgi:formylglycine-generating enzyme required for sulfatase activity